MSEIPTPQTNGNESASSVPAHRPGSTNRNPRFDVSACINRINAGRVPIRTKLTLFITMLIVIIMGVSGLYSFSVQRQEFIDQTTSNGSVLAATLARNSSVALLENDDASMNLLIEDISKIRDLAYVMIIDKPGVIRAHSEIARINTPYRPIVAPLQTMRNGSLEITRFRDGDREILDIAAPVSFNKVALGSVHLGMSLNTLKDKIFRSGLYALGLTAVLVGIGIAVSFSISTQFSRPIRNLLAGTEAIAEGNFSFQVEHRKNDELGDLSLAFNDMADKLQKKEQLRSAFGSYVNPEIVEMILRQPDGKWLPGKKIQATVLFTDIRGFTSFSEETPPEQVVALLNEHFCTVTDIILEHGGHIDKFIGDSVMAVFGALTAEPDHADRAVRAAVAIRKRLLADPAKTGERLRIGIGINTGEVIAGNIGSSKRMEYTVIGDSVNLAARLTGIAPPDEIIISSATHNAATVPIVAVKLEAAPIKGKQEAVEIYRLEDVL